MVDFEILRSHAPVGDYPLVRPMVAENLPEIFIDHANTEQPTGDRSFIDRHFDRRLSLVFELLDPHQGRSRHRAGDHQKIDQGHGQSEHHRPPEAHRQ